LRETPDVRQDEDTANSGLRREPDLPEHVAIASEATALPPASEFDVVDDTDDSVALQARTLSKQMRSVARQAALDPADGLGL
jgi:type IV secretion system protein VirD4